MLKEKKMNGRFHSLAFSFHQKYQLRVCEKAGKHENRFPVQPSSAMSLFLALIPASP